MGTGTTDRGAEMLGVGGDEAQCLGLPPEEYAVDDGLVLEGELAIGPDGEETWK